MQTPKLKAALVTFALASLAGSALAAPPAGQFQCSLTSPSTATGATIKITGSSKLIVKVSTGNVNFQLKVKGVTNAMDNPVTDMTPNTNTFQIDVIRPGGMLATQMFPFTISSGKVSQKFPVANGSFAGGALTTGDTIDIRAVRLVQGGTGDTFAVCGLTIK